jgi:hypothetical protein
MSADREKWQAAERERTAVERSRSPSKATARAHGPVPEASAFSTAWARGPDRERAIDHCANNRNHCRQGFTATADSWAMLSWALLRFHYRVIDAPRSAAGASDVEEYEAKDDR